MKTLRFLPVALFVALGILQAQTPTPTPTPGNWTSNGTSLNWGTASNWSTANIPDTNAEIAVFNNSDTAKAINVDGNYTINKLQFSSANYTLSNNTLTINQNVSDTTYNGILNNTANAQIINSNITIANSQGNFTTITSSASGGSITMNGNLAASTATNFSAGAGSLITVNGIISGAGIVRFGSNPTGATTIAGSGTASNSGAVQFSQGMVNLNRVGALSGSNYVMDGAATINLGADGAFGSANTFRVTNASASMNTNGKDFTLGAFDLDANSTMNLGAGDSNLVFANSSAQTWSGTAFAITGFTPGVDSIRFGTSALGLTADQLGTITLDGFAAQIDSSGFLVAVPEPATVLGGLFCTGALLLRLRRTKSA